MQKKFQIFVSSTFNDLQEERRSIIESILDMRHIPVGMESFQAGNEEQWSYIRKRIEQSDYYVVIIAERYGHEKDGVSYTEMEYDYAREKGVPVAAFLLSEDMRSEWRKEKADYIDNPQKVQKFRSKCQGLLVRYWKNKDDLSASCVKALSQMFEDFPRDGWIPAKDAASPEVANELARLIQENGELRKKLDIIGVNAQVDETVSFMRKLYINCPEGISIEYGKALCSLSKTLIAGIQFQRSMGGGIYMYGVNVPDDIAILFEDYSSPELSEYFDFLALHEIIFEDRFVTRSQDGRDRVETSFRLTELGKKVIRRLQA